jgi:hypothetical protein
VTRQPKHTRAFTTSPSRSEHYFLIKLLFFDDVLHRLLDLLGWSCMDTGDLLFFSCHMFWSHGDFPKRRRSCYEKGERHLSFSKPYEMNGFCKIIAKEEIWVFACTGKDDRGKTIRPKRKRRNTRTSDLETVLVIAKRCVSSSDVEDIFVLAVLYSINPAISQPLPLHPTQAGFLFHLHPFSPTYILAYLHLF